mmetsp:Transcript_44414/g.105221  ORF Transcript_44414/g.105221 Transcript_44414/m.105221 type:complete len:183 (+) Transcript_44414:65-613(+)
MSPKDAAVAAPAADDEEDDGENLFYASQKVLMLLKVKLDKGDEIAKDLLLKLSVPGDMDDEEMLLPIDLRCLDKEFPGEDLINESLHLDVERMVEKLGTKKAAEMFIKAQQDFLSAKDKMREEERLEPITAAQWRLDFGGDDLGLGGAEEDAEEEFFCEGDEEEDEGDGEAAEPEAKKAKLA